jgi:hypothetical protein
MFLPRSIDKARAALPGGNSGPYVIAGLTQTMLDRLGVPLDAFMQSVSAAVDDADVARCVRGYANAEQYEDWNAWLRVREPRGGNRAEALTVFPWLADRPDLTRVLDVLEEDDKRQFAASH